MLWTSLQDRTGKGLLNKDHDKHLEVIYPDTLHMYYWLLFPHNTNTKPKKPYSFNDISYYFGNIV